MRPLLCLVTDRKRLVPAERGNTCAELAAFVGAAAHAGVDLVQIREPDLEARDLYELVRSCLRAVEGSHARLLVNERVDVALAAGAAGVHLRGNSPPADRVRQLVPEGFLIGRSVHGVDEALAAAEDEGVDYLIAGAVFPSVSKPMARAWLGADGLRDLVSRVHTPVLAIGGANAATVPAIASTGAAGLAAIGMFTEVGNDPERLGRLVQEMKCLFDTSRYVP